MKISIVVPTHRRADILPTLLRSLLRQDFSRHQFEALVVSNLPDANVQRLVEELSAQGLVCRYLCVGQVGVNRARNLGLTAACGEIVYFLDDDCELIDRAHLSRLANYHRVRPDATGIGGRYRLMAAAKEMLPAQEVTAAPSLDAVSSPALGYVDAWLDRWQLDEHRCYQLIGGNMSFKRAHLENLRFDARNAFGGTEIAWNCELINRQHGLLTYRDLDVAHFSRVSMASMLGKAWRQGWQAARRQHLQLFYNAAALREFSGRPMRFPTLPWRAAICLRSYRLCLRAGFRFGQIVGWIFTPSSKHLQALDLAKSPSDMDQKNSATANSHS